MSERRQPRWEDAAGINKLVGEGDENGQRRACPTAATVAAEANAMNVGVQNKDVKRKIGTL